MPRFYIRSERKRREQAKFKVYTPWWQDPNWFLNGSSIEKMVMAELQRRGVFFIFQSQRNELGGFVDPSWEADFLLPHHKIWIEVQGSYFHSLTGQIEKDSLRYAAIEMAGWHPHFLWEFDIRTRLIDLLDEIGVFYMVNRSAEAEAASRYKASALYGSQAFDDLSFGVGTPGARTPAELDHLAGLRKALSNRTKPKQYGFKRQRRRRPKV